MTLFPPRRINPPFQLIQIRQSNETSCFNQIQGAGKAVQRLPDEEEPRQLHGLRLSLSYSQISSKTRSLTLWTERGAARHAKMLETDKAWDMFEQMEDAYFTASRKPASNDGAERSTKHDRLPLYHLAVGTGLTNKGGTQKRSTQTGTQANRPT